jgi:hypothetical protein
MPRFGALAGSPSLGALASRRGLPPGLVHAWTLDNTTNGYVDFARGLTLTQQGSGTSTAAGIIGDAASFNGSGNLTAGSLTLVQIGFAVEAWVYAATSVATYRVALSQFSSSGNQAFIIAIGAVAGIFSFVIVNSAGASREVNPPVVANTWYHAVLVVTSDQRVRAYLNGVLAGTSDVLAGSFSTNAIPLLIGNRDGTTFRWAGYVDEPRIWQFGAAGDPGAAFWAARHNGGVGRRP